jgi:aminopeptidase
VTTGSAYVVVSNGTLAARHPGASRTTWVYLHDRPMATYLASVQIGRYQLVELAAEPVPSVLACGAASKARARADFAPQPEMIRVFGELFGDYPFHSYTVVVTDDELEIPLEAQSLSIFGANHVDGDGSQERLIAHELAHQWFGNSLTAGSWRDIWLHEGFACYAEWLWSEHSGGPSADHCARRTHDRLSDLPQDLVVADPGPDLMFDDRLYKRGALTLHALRISLGDKHFFRMLREWVAEHAYGTVTTELFRRQVEPFEGSAAVLEAWLDRPELPALPSATRRPAGSR